MSWIPSAEASLPVVVDANLLVALAANDSRADLVADLFLRWTEAGEEIHLPILAQYEIASAFTRLIAAGSFSRELLGEAVAGLGDLPLFFHPLEQIVGVVEIALTLNRKSAYDASYVALALHLGADLWTLDGPLYRNAEALGFPVRLLSAPSQ